MRLRSLLAGIFLAVISFGLVSCAKSEKDKVIDVQKSMFAWIKSGDFMKELKANVKNPNDLNTYTEKKFTEILNKSGFKDMAEYEKAAEKYKDDEEMKKLETEMRDGSQKVFEEVMKFQMELMQANPELMPAPAQAETEAPAPETAPAQPEKK